MSREKKIDDGGPAFPQPSTIDPRRGMTLRDYFAVRAPAPTKEKIDFEAEQDRLRNPHGEAYKPARRSVLEIEWDLRYAWADAGIAARKRATME